MKEKETKQKGKEEGSRRQLFLFSFGIKRPASCYQLSNSVGRNGEPCSNFFESMSPILISD